MFIEMQNTFLTQLLFKLFIKDSQKSLQKFINLKRPIQKLRTFAICGKVESQ